MASELGVQTIQHTNGTDAMTIDSNGVVTRSALPAFMVSLTGDQNFTSSGTWLDITFVDTQTNSFVQGEMTLSSGVITVPVTGVYHFSANIRIDSVGSGFLWTQISKNDSEDNDIQHGCIDGSPDANYESLIQSGIYQMNANDTIRVKVFAYTDSAFHVARQSHFSGFLVG